MTETRPRRRTQESRSAETRGKALQAAIQSLYARGYAATNILSVANDSGLSRGGIQNQFPSKVDLMLYVVKTVYEEEKALYQTRLGAIADPRERMLAFPEIVWEVLSRPEGVAVLEILQGSRSDPELSARLRPLQMDIERDSLDVVASVAGAAGYDSTTPAVRLIVWAIRGLSVAQLLVEEPAEIRRSVRYLRRLLRYSLDRADKATTLSSRRRARTPAAQPPAE